MTINLAILGPSDSGKTVLHTTLRAYDGFSVKDDKYWKNVSDGLKSGNLPPKDSGHSSRFSTLFLHKSDDLWPRHNERWVIRVREFSGGLYCDDFEFDKAQKGQKLLDGIKKDAVSNSVVILVDPNRICSTNNEKNRTIRGINRAVTICRKKGYRVLLAVSQADRFERLLKKYRGARRFLRKRAKGIFEEVGDVEVIALSSLRMSNALTENDDQIPKQDSDSADGLRPLLKWVLRPMVRGVRLERLAKAAFTGLMAACLAYGLFVLGQSHQFAKYLPEALVTEAETQYQLGYEKLTSDTDYDPSAAKRWFERAAAQGHGDAELQLGNFSLDGTVGPRDLQSAEKHFRAAYEAGDMSAAYGLAYLYSGAAGDFYKTNFVEAVSLYREALEGGVEAAALPLAYILDWGAENVPVDQKEAARLYRIAADKGDDKATARLGEMYVWGLGVDKDAQKGKELLTRAANNGNTQAMSSLALCYFNGYGWDRDEATALKLANRASEAGEEIALFVQGCCYRFGTGGAERDLIRAVERFQASVKAGYKEAYKELAEILIEDQDGKLIDNVQEIVDGLERLVAENDPGAERLLCQLYALGRGVETNRTEAVKLCRSAAEKEDPIAACMLAGMLENGTEELARDMDEAIRYYKIAAEGGDLNAITRLAYLYAHGNGVPKDEKKAEELWLEAAKCDFPPAQSMLAERYIDARNPAAFEWASKNMGKVDYAEYQLGECYRIGLGVEKDLAKAVEHFNNAIGKGIERGYLGLGGVILSDKEGKFSLDKKQIFAKLSEMAEKDCTAKEIVGVGYLRGIITGVKNVEKAKEYLLSAAEEGNNDAMRLVGEMYEESGKNKEAFTYYCKSADAGSIIGLYHMGRCLSRGIGCDRDEAAAERCLNEALSKGVDRARVELAEIHYARKSEKAFDLASTAVKDGYKDAEYVLGCCYLKGLGVMRNLMSAEEYFMSAKSHKDDRAYVGLASIMIEEDAVVTFDQEEVFKQVLGMSAKDLDAKYVLGSLYYQGKGTKKNLQLAENCYREVLNGDPKRGDALCSMGKIMERRKNYKEALRYLREANEAGDLDGKFNLGSCYADGRGVAQDAPVAFRLFKEGADKGHARSMAGLGWLYTKGLTGVGIDYARAEYWYQRALDAGCVDLAARGLGILYYNGHIDGRKNYEKAYGLFNQSAASGDGWGCRNLGACYLNGNGVKADRKKARECFAKAKEIGIDWGIEELVEAADEMLKKMDKEDRMYGYRY